MDAIQRRINELHQFQAVCTPPDDLEAFWRRTEQEAIGQPFPSRRTEGHSLLSGMNVYEVEYEGYAETPIRAWLMTPAWKEGPYPALVTFPGYSGGKGNPEDYAAWVLMGAAVFAVDVRGQGGETGNRLGSAHGMARGWITEGLLELERSYYKAVSVDILRAVQWLTQQPDVDGDRIGVIGGSQGGGFALLASARHDAIRLTVADIPNLCHMDYGVLHSTGSLAEVADYCRRHPEALPAMLRHLGYFDMLHQGHRIRHPILMSVGLKDTVCTPEQVFPMYHAIASADKRLEIYPFTGHAVEAAQRRKAYRFVQERWSL